LSLLAADDRSEADLWLLNSCTVKSPAEDHFRNEITQANKDGKKLVLAGCVPQGQPNAQYMHVSVIFSFFYPNNQFSFVFIIYVTMLLFFILLCRA
jgi:tRNA A37 methylthiotransferase MiaB